MTAPAKQRDTGELMRAFGTKRGFTPIPPAQHEWQRSPDEPPVHRIWSWMIRHTCTWIAGPQKGSPYAAAVTEDGKERELHLEHIALDLFDGDGGRARRAWREGVERGLWRNGNETEGTRKLFLCGEVRPVAEPEERTESESKGLYRLFPAQILKQIKERPDDWPREKVERMAADVARVLEAERETIAVSVAAVRADSIERQNKIYASYGASFNSQPHQKKSETPEDAAERRARIAPLLPAVSEFVQTFLGSVQNGHSTPYNGENGGVHVETGGASLLQSHLAERKAREPVAGSGSDSAVVSRGPAKSKTPSHEEQKPPRPWHRFVSPEAVPVWNSEAETQARDLLLDQISRMQRAYKHADFSQELISLQKPTHELLVYRLVKIIPPEDAMLFCVQVAAKFKGLDRNGLAKLPPRSPDDPHGPRSLALLLEWAVDFAETRQKTRAARGGQ